MESALAPGGLELWNCSWGTASDPCLDSRQLFTRKVIIPKQPDGLS